jgi:hypothetical protein
LLLAHAKDVEEGLLNFPVTRFTNYEPVKEVLFNLNNPADNSKLVRTEEIQHGLLNIEQEV